MIQSPFLQEVHMCKGAMKKLRKKIYKFNINHQSKYQKSQSTIRDALTVLEKRNLPSFLISQLQKYSDMTFSSLSGFSLNQLTPISHISNLTANQEKQIFQMYHKNKRTIRKRKGTSFIIKLNKRETNASQNIEENQNSSTSLNSLFDEQIAQQESSCSQSISDGSQQIFEAINSRNQFEQDFNNSDAMFQSTMLDFGNQIEMDSQEFLFKY